MNEITSGFEKVEYEIKGALIYGIFDVRYLIKNKLITTDDESSDFGNKLENNLSMVGDILEQQLQPLSGGLKTMLTKLFDVFLSDLSTWQEQQTNILDYVLLIGTSVGFIFILNKIWYIIKLMKTDLEYSALIKKKS